MTVTKPYEEGHLYSTLEYGAPYVSKGLKFARYIIPSILNKVKKVLCIGCGNGFEVVEYLRAGFNAYGTEMRKIGDVPILKDRIIHALVPDLPFKDKAFDFVACTEVLEHVSTEETSAFLAECFRVGKSAMFSIATRDDPPWHTHCNIQTPQWWLDEMEKHKVEVLSFQFCPIVDLQIESDITYRCRYGDGVTFYVNCRV